MKRHWRRWFMTLTAVIAVVMITAVGTVLWLQHSGRLARFAQDNIQQMSGQDITLDAITFPSWNTLSVSDIRLRPPLPGWQVEVVCPRLDVHFSVTSLLHRTINTLVLVQPTLRLTPLDHASKAPASPKASGPIAIPVRHIQIQHGTLQIQDGNAAYLVKEIEASIRPDNAATAYIEAQAMFGPNAATLQGQGRIGLDFSQPSGNGQIKIASNALPQLHQSLSGRLPPTWSIAQGQMETTAEIKLRDQTLQGTLKTTLTQGHGTIAAVAIRAMTLSTEMAINARITPPHLNLKGTAQIQAERVSAPGERLAQQLVVDTPINLTLTPEAWQLDLELAVQSLAFSPSQAVRFTQLSSTIPLTVQSTKQGWSGQGHIKVTSPTVVIGEITQPTTTLINLSGLQSESAVRFTATSSQEWTATADVSLQSQQLQVGPHIRASQFSSTFPLHLQVDSQPWHLQGTANLTAQTVHYERQTTKTSGAQPATHTVLDSVQLRLPIRVTATAIELENTHLQAQDGRWLTADTVHLQTPLEIRATSQIDFKRQHLNLKRLDLTLPGLGTSWGSGKWAWEQQALQDLHLEVRPVTAGVLWNHLSTWLPAPYPAWQVDGQTHLTLQTKRFSWHLSAAPPWWHVTWHLDQMAFNSPEANIATEHLSGTLQARVQRPRVSPSGSSPYAFDGRLHLKPFALLIGHFFPALEHHHVVTNITMAGTYHPQTSRLTLNVEGQVGKLGRFMGQGTLHRASTSWHYEATGALQDLNASQIWQTFLSTPTSEPTAASATPPSISGTLNANVTVRGQDTSAHLQGQLNLTAFHLQSDHWTLADTTLKLPVDLHYPLPQTTPNTATLPSTAYGRLKIGRAQLGGISLPAIDTLLALQSDSLIFADNILLPLLGGHLRLLQLKALQLLQPQRRIQTRLVMYNLNLQHLQRHAAKLPIAGRVNAEFPRLQIDGTRLVTEGAMTLDVAGGRVRIAHLQGHDLFSSIPSLGATIRTDAPLSLLQLTQIYPIGDIGGTLHFNLDDLTVTAGEPAAFHLVFNVQEKHSEKREITLRALNNLLFTTGSAKVDAGQAYRLPYKRFGADITLQHDILRLRGLYHDQKGREYFMQAPLLGGGVSIINRVPQHGVPFRSFIQRLKAAVLEPPTVKIK